MSNFVNTEKFLNKELYIDVTCEIHGKTESLNGKCDECREDKILANEQKKRKYTIESLTKRYIANESNIPLIYQDSRFNNYPVDIKLQAKVIRELQETEDKKNILFFGTTGMGKTRLACAHAAELIQNEISKYDDKKLNQHDCRFELKNIVYYQKFYNLTDLKIKNYAKFEELFVTNFLIIDELGVGDSEFKSEVLFEIIDQRYDRGLNTMLIANLKINEWKDKLAAPLFGRLKQNCHVICEAWKDYRINP